MKRAKDFFSSFFLVFSICFAILSWKSLKYICTCRSRSESDNIVRFILTRGFSKFSKKRARAQWVMKGQSHYIYLINLVDLLLYTMRNIASHDVVWIVPSSESDSRYRMVIFHVESFCCNHIEKLKALNQLRDVKKFFSAFSLSAEESAITY